MLHGPTVRPQRVGVLGDHVLQRRRAAAASGRGACATNPWLAVGRVALRSTSACGRSASSIIVMSLERAFLPSAWHAYRADLGRLGHPGRHDRLLHVAVPGVPAASCRSSRSSRSRSWRPSCASEAAADAGRGGGVMRQGLLAEFAAAEALCAAAREVGELGYVDARRVHAVPGRGARGDPRVAALAHQLGVVRGRLGDGGASASCSSGSATPGAIR